MMVIKVMKAKMETAVNEIGRLSVVTAVSSVSGVALTMVSVGLNSLPQCQQTVSVGRIIWSQFAHFKATKSPLFKSVN